MRALVFENGRAAVRDVRRPAPRGGFALVRVLLSGICNTDLELKRGYHGFSRDSGHEFVGVVEGPADSAAPRPARRRRDQPRVRTLRLVRRRARPALPEAHGPRHPRPRGRARGDGSRSRRRTFRGSRGPSPTRRPSSSSRSPRPARSSNRSSGLAGDARRRPRARQARPPRRGRPQDAGAPDVALLGRKSRAARGVVRPRRRSHGLARRHAARPRSREAARHGRVEVDAPRPGPVRRGARSS